VSRRDDAGRRAEEARASDRRDRIPKTIDNDIHFIDRSFGFETSFSAAGRRDQDAHVEAKGAKGVGLVKCMVATRASSPATPRSPRPDVDFVLIPEVNVHLEGETGLLRLLERRLARDSHAVIVVAEGGRAGFV